MRSTPDHSDERFFDRRGKHARRDHYIIRGTAKLIGFTAVAIVAMVLMFTITIGLLVAFLEWIMGTG